MKKILRSLSRPFVLAAILVIGLSGTVAFAEVSVPTLFSDHMVLQRQKPIQIWGWADPGEAVKVELAGKSSTAKTNKKGGWSVTLPPMAEGGPYVLKISGKNTLTISDVLLGEVWIASGQSNMFFQVNRATNADLNELTANRKTAIRFNHVRNMGSQEPQYETTDVWQEINPQTIGNVSAVAYAFAETLHDTLGIPIGVIENSWGGSAAEAWVPRDVIAADPELMNIHEEWLETEATYDFEEEMANYETKLAKWKEAVKEARVSGEKPPNSPRKPTNQMTAQHRPSNLWNGRVLPIAPIAMRGAIWYQGEGNSNTVERAQQYEHLFSTMITQWRKLWDQEFPFYFVQLADFKDESEFGENETWPFLRNSQTGTMQNLPYTGQAVITDIGEGKDIHPKQKEEVGRRLARWALNRDYGFKDLAYRSPEIAGWKQNGNKVVVDFNYTGAGLRPFDTQEVKGFVVKCEGEQWHVVEGLVQGGNSVELEVADGLVITAVGYAWANNPICNLFTIEGLPVTPFRTDVK